MQGKTTEGSLDTKVSTKNEIIFVVRNKLNLVSSQVLQRCLVRLITCTCYSFGKISQVKITTLLFEMRSLISRTADANDSETLQEFDTGRFLQINQYLNSPPKLSQALSFHIFITIFLESRQCIVKTFALFHIALASVSSRYLYLLLRFSVINGRFFSVRLVLRQLIRHAQMGSRFTTLIFVVNSRWSVMVSPKKLLS